MTDAAKELYSLPRAAFVATRDAIAKELRDAGERAAATEVKRFTRPTLVSAAINRAVRAKPETVEQLMQTVAALQRPSSGDTIRALADRHDELVGDLATRADEAAGGGRRSELAAAIRAAVTSPDAQRFVDGTLSATPMVGEDSLAAALAAGAGAAPTRRPASEPDPPATTRSAKAGTGSDESSARADARADTARRRELRDALTDARGDEREARSVAVRMQRDVKSLERELATERAHLANAEDALAAASGEVDRLETELRETRD